MAAAATAEFYAAVVWRPAQAHILYSFSAAQKIRVQRSKEFWQMYVKENGKSEKEEEKKQ